MAFEKTWFTVDAAAEKFGLDRRVLLKWVDEGLVRSETSGTQVQRINIDDVALKVQEMTGI